MHILNSFILSLCLPFSSWVYFPMLAEAPEDLREFNAIAVFLFFFCCVGSSCRYNSIKRRVVFVCDEIYG